MFSKWRAIVKTRSVYHATDLQEEDISECVIIILPKWAWYVARSLLFDYGTRISSFSVAYRARSYKTPSVSEWDQMQDLISKGVNADMCSVNTIAQQLALIRGAVTGGEIDLDNLPITGIIDFGTDAVTPKLEEIRAELEASSLNFDELETLLEAIAVILGATV